MTLHIALNIYRAWSRWERSTQTAIRALITFQSEAWKENDAFAAGVMRCMTHEMYGYPAALEPNN